MGELYSNFKLAIVNISSSVPITMITTFPLNLCVQGENLWFGIYQVLPCNDIIFAKEI